MNKHYYLKEVAGEGKYPVTLTKDGKTYIPDIDGRHIKADVTMEWNSSHSSYCDFDDLCDFHYFYSNAVKEGYAVSGKAISKRELNEYLSIAPLAPLSRTFANTDGMWLNITAKDLSKDATCMVKNEICSLFHYDELSLKGLSVKYLGDELDHSDFLLMPIEDVRTLLNRHKMMPLPYSFEDCNVISKLDLIGTFCAYHNIPDAFDAVSCELEQRLRIQRQFDLAKQIPDTLTLMKRTEEARNMWKDRIWKTATAHPEKTQYDEYGEKLSDAIYKDGYSESFIASEIYSAVDNAFDTFFDEEADMALQLIGIVCIEDFTRAGCEINTIHRLDTREL